MEKKYIYICAAARSGSTLLDMLLGGHSQGESLGEFSFLGKAIALKQECGCGAPMISCSQWDKVYSKVLLEKGIDLKIDPYGMRQWDTRATVKIRIDKDQQTRKYIFFSKVRNALVRLHFRLKWLNLPMPSSLTKGIENTAYLYDAVLETREKSFIVDSSKNFLKAIALYKSYPKKTKILLLTRDGRGVFHSRYSSGFTKKESFRGWYKYYSGAFFYLKKFIKKEDLLIIRYEDLVTDLEGELRKICSWAGIDFEKKMIELAVGERHLVDGNATRFRRNKGVKLDERWTTELNKKDLNWFMKKGGALNSKLGYK